MSIQVWIAIVVGLAAVIDDLARRHIANWIPIAALAGGFGWHHPPAAFTGQEQRYRAVQAAEDFPLGLARRAADERRLRLAAQDVRLLQGEISEEAHSVTTAS